MAPLGKQYDNSTGRCTRCGRLKYLNDPPKKHQTCKVDKDYAGKR